MKPRNYINLFGSKSKIESGTGLTYSNLDSDGKSESNKWVVLREVKILEDY